MTSMIFCISARGWFSRSVERDLRIGSAFGLIHRGVCLGDQHVAVDQVGGPRHTDAGTQVDLVQADIDRAVEKRRDSFADLDGSRRFFDSWTNHQELVAAHPANVISSA